MLRYVCVRDVFRFKSFSIYNTHLSKKTYNFHKKQNINCTHVLSRMQAKPLSAVIVIIDEQQQQQ